MTPSCTSSTPQLLMMSFAGNRRAIHRADDGAKLFERAVILRPAKEPHVAVRDLDAGPHRVHGAAVRADERAAADVLVRERLAEHARRRRHRTSEQLWNLLEKVLIKRAPLLLQLVRVQVIELRAGVAELERRRAVLALEYRDDRRDVLEVSLLQQTLEEVTQLRHPDVRSLVSGEPPVAPPLELVRVRLLLANDSLAVVLVRAEQAIAPAADAAARDGREERPAAEERRLEQPPGGLHEEFDVARARKLRDPRVKLRGHDDGAAKLRVAVEDDASRRRVVPVAVIFQAEDDVIFLLHLGAHEILHGSARLLRVAVLPPGRGGDQTGRCR